VKTQQQVVHLLKLRLLALVLALALTWYALNPAPGPVRHNSRRPDDEPDELRREEKSRLGGAVSADAGLGRTSLRQNPAAPSVADEVAELDWPEYLSLD
jgi:hypothetical protein